jgi:hypothetical protein
MFRNITLSAEDGLIEAARERAHVQHTSLNALFREWLASYAYGSDEPDSKVEAFNATMEKLSYVRSGHKFSREDLNER